MKKLNWSVMAMVLVAISLLAATGCTTKKPKLPKDQGDLQGETLYDENGNPYTLGPNGEIIYLDPSMNPMGDRFGEEVGGGFEAVYFAYDNSQIDPNEMGKIQAVVSYLNANPSSGLVVEGHCDERGSNEYNLALGERRALAVRAEIIGSGIDASRITTRSFGEESPISMGHDESSWMNNRRAEFVVTQ